MDCVLRATMHTVDSAVYLKDEQSEPIVVDELRTTVNNDRRRRRRALYLAEILTLSRAFSISLLYLFTVNPWSLVPYLLLMLNAQRWERRAISV
jgi:hypothetical protein